MKLKDLFKLRVRVLRKYEQACSSYEPKICQYYLAQYRKGWWPFWATIRCRSEWGDSWLFWPCPHPMRFNTEREALQALDIIVRYN